MSLRNSKITLLAAAFAWIFPAFAVQPLQILSVTDGHGQWYGEPERGWKWNASLIAERRAEAGAENTLLIDCGDELAGSWELSLNRGAMGIAILEHMKFDVFVLGNHDFEWGVARLHELLARFSGKVLAGNVPGFDGVAWFERAGLRIAVIGLTTDSLSWYLLRPEELPEIAPERESLTRYMEEARSGGAQVIVLALHRGVDSRFGSLEELLKDFADIDLVIGGHSHVVETGSLVRDIPFAAAGSHGEGVLAVTLTPAAIPKPGSAQIEIEWAPVTTKTPAHQALVQAIETEFSFANELYPVRFKPALARAPKRYYASSFGTFAMKAILAEPQRGDVVLFSSSSRSREYPELWNSAGLYRLFPYEDWVVSWPVSAGELREILDEQLDESRRSASLVTVRGITAELSIDGWIDVLEPDLPEYRVWTVGFLAAGAGGRYEALHRSVRAHREEMRFHGLIRDRARALMRRRTMNVEPVSWVIQRNGAEFQ